MATDADDATSALIAQMLAADYAAAVPSRATINYGNQYSDEEEEEPEFNSRRKKKKRKSSGKPKQPKPPKVKKPKVVKPKKTKAVKPTTDGTKQKTKPRKWTSVEESMFLEALNLYGRDWSKCVAHLKEHNRDRGSFTSHAQKHFIRLYRDDLPLPAKVIESGAGYTLSGKPLDKDSAAARQYGAAGPESQAAYKFMVKLRKEEPKKVLLELVRCQLIQFGPNVLSMTYKGTTYTADFKEDATIVHDGEMYSSPSAFSIALKRKAQPDKKGDNGWTSVRYKDETLDSLRTKLADLQAKAEMLNKGIESTSTYTSAPTTTSTSSSSNASPKDQHESKGTAAMSTNVDTTPNTSATSSSSRKPLSARAKNDLLLVEAKKRGDKTTQKTGKPLTPKELVARDLILEQQRQAMALKAQEKAAVQAKKKEEKRKKKILLEQKKKEKQEIRLSKKRKKQEKIDQKRQRVERQYGQDGRTDYSRKRSRRKAATKYQNADSGSLEFVDCRNYRTDVLPGSNMRDAQPFSIDVGVGAAIMVDLHSHFTKCEVIGYLAVCCF